MGYFHIHDFLISYACKCSQEDQCHERKFPLGGKLREEEDAPGEVGILIDSKKEGRWENKRTTKPVNNPYGFCAWRTIRNLWPIILNRSSLKVGIGRKESSWENSWIGQCPMKLSYPDYNLCQNQEATVEEMWSHNGWNFSFRRHLNDSEIGRTTEFLNTLEGLIDSEDCMVWKGDSQGRFSVKSVYRDFNRSNNQDNLVRRGSQLCSRRIYVESKQRQSTISFYTKRRTIQSESEMEDCPSMFLVDFIEGIRDALKIKGTLYRS
ncbi:hypothetical protein H5410_017808 [Solanum commersonii]|uniref:Uncharacterized protein n=1 Tax=Solanum commersonii TaxID=4109 RepID=A0A9J6A0I7_SOLCO|nr:hypothetical protein H5410_017808 [Solanum commersonii]